MPSERPAHVGEARQGTIYDEIEAERVAQAAATRRTTIVMNLATSEQRVYVLPPLQSVIAAYAQDRGDFNSWEYNAHYGAIVEVGRWHVFAGDWAALAVAGIESVDRTESTGEQ